jgi:HSP20 family protein
MATSLFPRGSETKGALFRQDPFRALRNEVERLFESFDWRQGLSGADLMPRIDVCETDGEIDIDAELPGLTEKDIDVTLSGDTLIIRGEKKAEREEKKKNYHVSERSYGSFSRSIPLPFEADANKVSAKFDKGVLHIAIPKPPEAASKSAKIPVKTG